MSYVIAAPDVLAAAAAKVASIGSSVSAANSAAAASTTGVVAAAGDEVSAAVASVFSDVAKQFQALSAQAATFQSQFVQALTGSGGAYAAAEATNAASISPYSIFAPIWNAVADASGATPPPRTDILGTVMYELNQTSQQLVGAPLFFDGADGTQASPNGQNGGLLLGNGGKGWDSTISGVAGGNGGQAGIFGNGGAGGLGGAGAAGG
uniref:PE family protein n=1 Tax=Mycobacterium sp. UM_CSW TaxID=1370119 RepID=UPI0023B849AA